MLALPIDPPTRDRLSWLHDWTGREFDRLRAAMEARRRDGFVRECHGDLHLGNIAWIDGAPVLFDAIEFNADLRWIGLSLGLNCRPEACELLDRLGEVRELVATEFDALLH
jgi:hypothetical protein